MISPDQLRTLAMSLEDVTEEPHFEKVSFRIRKKIFATFDRKLNLVTVKLNPVDQASFCSFNREVMYPVPNKWGQSGWTFIALDKIGEEMLTDALTTAYNEVRSGKKK